MTSVVRASFSKNLEIVSLCPSTKCSNLGLRLSFTQQSFVKFTLHFISFSLHKIKISSRHFLELLDNDVDNYN